MRYATWLLAIATLFDAQAFAAKNRQRSFPETCDQVWTAAVAVAKTESYRIVTISKEEQLISGENTVRIRSFLKALAIAALVTGIAFVGVSLIGLFSDSGSSPSTAWAVTLAVSIAISIGAGILWMLAEISEQLAELPEDLRQPQRNDSNAAAHSASPLHSPPQPHA
jgi:hypothetical protein